MGRMSKYNVQKHGPYAPIALKILDELALSPLKQREYKLCLAIMRHTYGDHHKKGKHISLKQLEKWTGLKKPHIYSALKHLEKHNVIICLRVQKSHQNGDTSVTKTVTDCHQNGDRKNAFFWPDVIGMNDVIEEWGQKVACHQLGDYDDFEKELSC
jgi:phage replication O-like protein O